MTDSVKRRDLIQQKQEVTSKISETTRYISFGLLIVFYSVHSSGEEFTDAIRRNDLLKVMVASGALAILMDYVQYVAGAMSVEGALKRSTEDYDASSASYRLRQFAFYSKQLLAIIGSISLIILVGLTVF